MDELQIYRQVKVKEWIAKKMGMKLFHTLNPPIVGLNSHRRYKSISAGYYCDFRSIASPRYIGNV